MAADATTAETAATTPVGDPKTDPPKTDVPATTETDALPQSIKDILEKERKAARDADRRAKAAEKKAQEYEDRDKTAEEQAKSQAERAEARAADAEKRLIRMQVALEKKVPADLMEFLSGDDRAEIEKKADALMAHLKPAAARDFDSGPRDVVEKPPSVEESHQSVLVDLLRAKGKLPPT
jgi:transposase